MVHNHGTARPCRFRVGMNEGIAILNNQANVSEMFTDGLIGCTQVIFRNATATFVTHIGDGAPLPVEYVLGANRYFIGQHGAITDVWVVTGAGAGAGGTIHTKLNNTLGRAGININRVTGCGGKAINISTGAIRDTPVAWNASQLQTAGYNTAQDLISFRFLDRGATGAEVLTGDYYELCGDCQ